MSSEKMETGPHLRYNNDQDHGMIEMFIDGELISTWVYEDEPELSFIEFKRIFMLGFNYKAESK